MAYENLDYTHLTPEQAKTVEDIAEAIRNKAYGIDVREAMARALEIVANAISLGGGQESLHLSIRMSDLSQEVKEALTGGAVPVVGRNSVGTENIKDNSVKPLHASFVEEGINKFNYRHMDRGGFYNASGNWESNSSVSMSDFISYKPGQTVSYLQTELVTAVITYWDGDKNFLHGANITTSSMNRGSVGVHQSDNSSARYIRVSSWNATEEKAMVTVGDEMPSEYVPYEIRLPNLGNEELFERIGYKSRLNLTPYNDSVLDFNENPSETYFGFGFQDLNRTILNAPTNRNKSNAFYYWVYLHNQKNGVMFINQIYMDALTAEVWVRNATGSISRDTISPLQDWTSFKNTSGSKDYSLVQGIGDSIMYGLPDTGSGRLTNPWISQIANKFNAEVSNLGINSSTIATDTNNQIPGFSNSNRNPIVNRLDALNTSADLTILEGGINDFWLGVPLGSFNDTTTDTFYGALHKYYGTVAEVLNDKKVVVMTCLQYGGTNPNNVSLHEWTRAQIEVANYYSLPVFDAYSDAGITPRIASQKTKYMNDGLHLSQAGADRFAERFGNFLNTI